MELFKEIMIGVLRKEEVNIVFPNINMSAAEIVDMQCYKTLQKIKAVIENDSLSDCSETTGYAGGKKKLLALQFNKKTPFDII